MADFTDQNIQDTYQRVVQIDNGQLQDGTGSVILSSTELSSIQAIGDSNAITSTEWAELKNIGSAEISSTEWGYVATMQDVSTTSTPLFSKLSLNGEGSINDPVLSFTGVTGSVNNPQIGYVRGGAMFFHPVGNPDNLAITFINQNADLAATIDTNGIYRSLLSPYSVAVADNANNATNATNVDVANDTGNAEHPITFIDDTSPDGDFEALKANAGITVNPSTNGLTLGQITASGNISASGTATFNALVAAGLTYPTTDGDDGNVLMTDGAGGLTLQSNVNYVNVKNVHGSTLAKGTPVHATGTSGNTPEVIAASSSVAASMPATFVLAEQLTNGSEGRAILSGFLNGLNTSNGFTEGDVLYVAPDGGYTPDKPTGVNLIQNIAIVGKIDASNGSIFVYGSGRSNDTQNLLENHIFYGSGSNQQYQLHISGALDSTVINNITASGDISASGNITAPSYTGQLMALDRINYYITINSNDYFLGRNVGVESGDFDIAPTSPFSINDEQVFAANILPVSMSTIGLRSGIRVAGGGTCQLWITTGSRSDWPTADTVPLGFGASGSLTMTDGQDFGTLDIPEFSINDDCDVVYVFVRTPDTDNPTVRITGQLYGRTR